MKQPWPSEMGALALWLVTLRARSTAQPTDVTYVDCREIAGDPCGGKILAAYEQNRLNRWVRRVSCARSTCLPFPKLSVEDYPVVKDIRDAHPLATDHAAVNVHFENTENMRYRAEIDAGLIVAAAMVISSIVRTGTRR